MIEDRKVAISIIEGQIRALTASGASPSVIKALKSIVQNAKKDLGETPKHRKEAYEEKKENITKNYYDASLSEIERIINENPSRMDLESIAIQRFNVPKGSIRSLGGKEGIIRAITSFIRNQKAHTTISDLASRSPKEKL